MYLHFNNILIILVENIKKDKYKSSECNESNLSKIHPTFNKKGQVKLFLLKNHIYGLQLCY